jgi:hypothetical protein
VGLGERTVAHVGEALDDLDEDFRLVAKVVRHTEGHAVEGDCENCVEWLARVVVVSGH